MVTWSNMNDLMTDIYDAEYKDLKDDVFFYEDIYNTFKPEKLLEIGGGTGRITLPLLRKNLGQIDICELSENSIKKLKKKMNEERIQNRPKNIYQGDFLEYEIEEKYDMIIIPFNTFFLFADFDMQAKVINKCHSLLKKEGKFIFDVFPPHQLLNQLHAGENFHHKTTKVIPETGSVLTRFDKQYLDIVHQKVYNLSIYDISDADGALWRYYFTFDIQMMDKNTLDYLLKINHFNVTDVYGDFIGNQLTEHSKKMIYICEVAE